MKFWSVGRRDLRITSGLLTRHLPSDLRLIEDSTTGVPCTTTSNLPEGYQGFAFLRRDLRLLLFDLAAGEPELPRLSLLANVVLPLASNCYSISQQKYQRQEAQQCERGNHLVSRRENPGYSDSITEPVKFE